MGLGSRILCRLSGSHLWEEHKKKVGNKWVSYSKCSRCGKEV